jgi:anthranilate phosphoribosyltransferase
VNEVGIGFMMSPKYHPAMKIVRPVRKQLKVRTVFNILGPMLNPAQAPFAVVGVYTEDLVSSILDKLIDQPCTHVFSINLLLLVKNIQTKKEKI